MAATFHCLAKQAPRIRRILGRMQTFRVRAELGQALERVPARHEPQNDHGGDAPGMLTRTRANPEQASILAASGAIPLPSGLNNRIDTAR
jgi:hypothetical protein